MIGIILTESAKIQPMGWVLIIGFVVILVVGVIIGGRVDKKNRAKFEEEEAKRFEGKKVYGNDVVFITSDNELVVRYDSTGLRGYKIFKLENVKYIMSCWDSTVKQWYIGLYDEKKKGIKGEDHNSGTKPFRKAGAGFHGRSEDVEFLEMIMKFVPDAQLVGLYFKEYKGGLKK